VPATAVNAAFVGHHNSKIDLQDHGERLIAADPAVRHGLTCKAYPMPGAFVRR